MRRNLPKAIFTICFLINLSSIAICREIDSTSFKLFPRHSFYSAGNRGEFLLHIPPSHRFSNLVVTINLDGVKITGWKGTPGKEILQIPFQIGAEGVSGALTAEIISSHSEKTTYKCSSKLLILNYKPNEVKTDRLTGGLIVNGLPFFPFGFYTYSPVHPALPEEEVVKGFNLISPYQRILPETLDDRKKYMDRCAQLGMKVNYNLISVAGGGGVTANNNRLSEEEKRRLLINEVQTFMDHPALLSWYIADEPDGSRIAPSFLEEIYRVIKEIDPWHPVTMVFMTPFRKAKDYAGALDIVMADPYPIPVYPVTRAGDAARMLKREFEGSKPVWIVPQAFGGGEHWLREPTLQELRSMTWQAIIEGATGIQYFIRQGLNAFPKSTAAWNECGRMAMEINAIVPWLLSDEKTIPARCQSPEISVSSRLYRGQLLVMAVNKSNYPLPVTISVEMNVTKRARVMFENRSVQVNNGSINDYIQAFGSQVYKIDIDPPKERVIPYRNNLINDPGFEDLSSPGVPSACYARPGSDRGATYFTDPRVTLQGNYSLRLITPARDSGATLRFFPVDVVPGRSYMISVWAKADPEQRFFTREASGNQENDTPQYVTVGLSDFHRARFVPEKEWKKFVTFVTIPGDTVSRKKVNVILRMPGQGVAWFDMLQMVEDN